MKFVDMQFDIDADLNPKVSDELIRLIGGLTIAWASYDSVVTFFLLQAFGIPKDTGSMLVSHMGTDSKLQKIQTLHEHYGYHEAAKAVKALRNAHEKTVEHRNIMAHQRLVGTLRNNPNVLCYAAVRAIIGKVGDIGMIFLEASDISSAIEFAKTAERELLKLIDSEHIAHGLKPAQQPG